MVIGIPHQLLGDDVHDGITVGDDGVKLFVEPDAYLRRKLRAVHLVSLLIADLPQGLVGVFDHRRALVRADGSDGLAHPQDQLRIVDDDPVGGFCIVIPEAGQHLLGGAKIHRGGPLGGFHKVDAFVKIFDDLPVDGVPLLGEMHVSHGADRFSQFFSQPEDAGIDLHDVLPGLYRGFFIQGHIHEVFRRQHLQIIVKGGDGFRFLIRHAPQKRVVKLAALAAGAKQKPVPQGSDEALGHPGLSVEIVDVGRGKQPIHVGPAQIVFREDRNVFRGQLFDHGLVKGLRLPQGVHVFDALLLKPLAEL